MSEEQNKQDIVLFLLATHELSKAHRDVGSTPDATQKLWDYIQQGPSPPWNILIAFPFPVFDAALAHYIDGIPSFLEQRTKATGVEHSLTLQRTQMSVGSSHIVMQMYALGETFELTIETRAMINDRTLFFTKVEPRTEMGKFHLVGWLGPFFEWFLREQRTWQETEAEEEAKERFAILPDGSLFTLDPNIYQAYSRHPVDEALDQRDSEIVAGRRPKTLQKIAEITGYSLDTVKDRSRKRKNKDYTKIHQNTPKSKPTNDE